MTETTTTPTDPLIPADARRAARRAFLRTLAQGYYSALAGLTISAGSVLAIVRDPDWALYATIAAVWALTPVVGALAAYLSVINQGIPTDYAPVIVDVHGGTAYLAGTDDAHLLGEHGAPGGVITLPADTAPSSVGD